MGDKLTFKGFQILVTAFKGAHHLVEELSCEWVTGGWSGGSCWGNQPSSLPEEPEKYLTDLDRLLEVFFPEITYLQYKKLISDVVEYTDRLQREYYGNSVEYRVKQVSLWKLYDRLNALGVFDNLLILIAGLPGSGKTTLAKFLGGRLYDDPMSENAISEINIWLDVGEPLVVVTDPHFIRREVRKAAEAQLHLSNRRLLWLHFENNPKKCIANIKRRNDPTKSLEPGTIRALSRSYEIEDALIEVKVWSPKRGW